MSFIDDSEQNMEKYVSSLKEENKSVPLLKEQTGGSVAGFVGGAGMGIDALFAGPFHPDSGHGSKNKQLLQKQLKDREKLDKLSTDDEYAGENPVGGYYEVDVDAVTLAYDELEQYNQASMDYNTENTPLADIEWKSSGWDYDYDEDELYIEEEDFINTSTTNTELSGNDIKYDEIESYISQFASQNPKKSFKVKQMKEAWKMSKYRDNKLDQQIKEDNKRAAEEARNAKIAADMKYHNEHTPTATGGMTYNEIVDSMVQDRSPEMKGRPGGIGGKELMATGGRVGLKYGGLASIL